LPKTPASSGSETHLLLKLLFLSLTCHSTIHHIIHHSSPFHHLHCLPLLIRFPLLQLNPQQQQQQPPTPNMLPTIAALLNPQQPPTPKMLPTITAMLNPQQQQLPSMSQVFGDVFLMLSHHNSPHHASGRGSAALPSSSSHTFHGGYVRDGPSSGTSRASSDTSRTSSDASSAHPVASPPMTRRVIRERSRRNNNNTRKRLHPYQIYTIPENMFIIYHYVDLGLSWYDIESRYKKWFPSRPGSSERLDRTRSGLQCQYYRLNSRIPKLNAEGLLDLGPFTAEERKDRRVVSQEPYPFQGGVVYRVCQVKCRGTGPQVSLFERFPEEVVFGDYPWILPEHQTDERMIAAGKFPQMWYTQGRLTSVDKTAMRRRHQRDDYVAIRPSSI